MAAQSQSDCEVSADALSVIAPWESNPYQLVSWWDMEYFSAAAFFWAGQIMESLKTDCIMKPGAGDRAFAIGALYESLDDKTYAKAVDSLTKVERDCRHIGLQISADTIKHEVLDRLQEKAPSYQWLMHQVNSLQRLMQREMKGRLFLYVSPEKSKFWPSVDEPHAFGKKVQAAFPSAAFDIHHGSIGLAVNMSTASVFHMMRVLEITLGVVGAKFGVPLAHTNWQNAIDQIESKVRDMHNDPAWKLLSDWKEQREFYAQAVSHFALLKDAWRNYTMHVRAKYTEQEAEQIYRNVRSFTQKLAERLSE